MSKKTSQDFIDISLESTRKKRIRVDGDDNRILELNTSDLGIFGRLKESEQRIVDITKDAMQNWQDDETEDSLSLVADKFKQADEEMRKVMDYIFDANVSSICAPSGTMFDPINGKFRYEHILEVVGSVYEADLTTEITKLSSRVKKHTDKYTK